MTKVLEVLPEKDTTSAKLVTALKYGENGPQIAGLYSPGGDHPLLRSKYIHLAGSLPSMVGEADFSRAQHALTQMAAGFDHYNGKVPLVAVVVKHGNPAGSAEGDDGVDVAWRTVMGDPVAAFGGVIITNFEITAEIAQAFKRASKKSFLRRLFNGGRKEMKRVFGGVYAPSITPEALDILKRIDNSCCIMVNPALSEIDYSSMDTHEQRIPMFGGEYVLQTRNTFVLDPEHDEYFERGRRMTYRELRDMIMGVALCANSVSNTITIVKDGSSATAVVSRTALPPPSWPYSAPSARVTVSS
jgi:AICAR transformylase/IMP cyclohydrolase PurH